MEVPLVVAHEPSNLDFLRLQNWNCLTGCEIICKDGRVFVHEEYLRMFKCKLDKWERVDKGYSISVDDRVINVAMLVFYIYLNKTFVKINSRGQESICRLMNRIGMASNWVIETQGSTSNAAEVLESQQREFQGAYVRVTLEDESLCSQALVNCNGRIRLIPQHEEDSEFDLDSIDDKEFQDVSKVKRRLKTSKKVTNKDFIFCVSCNAIKYEEDDQFESDHKEHARGRLTVQVDELNACDLCPSKFVHLADLERHKTTKHTTMREDSNPRRRTRRTST